MAGVATFRRAALRALNLAEGIQSSTISSLRSTSDIHQGLLDGIRSITTITSTLTESHGTPSLGVRFGQTSWIHTTLGVTEQEGASETPSPSQASPPAGLNPLQQTPVTATAGQTDDIEERQIYSPSKAGEKCAQAVLRGARIGPRKLNMFVDVFRGLHIEDALIQCQIHHKKAARLCEKLLLSAKANATNNHGLDGSKLKVKEAWVGKGKYLRRISIHGRGRSGVMHKYRSHLTIILKEEETPRRTKVIPMLQERVMRKRQYEAM